MAVAGQLRRSALGLSDGPLWAENASLAKGVGRWRDAASEMPLDVLKLCALALSRGGGPWDKQLIDEFRRHALNRLSFSLMCWRDHFLRAQPRRSEVRPTPFRTRRLVAKNRLLRNRRCTLVETCNDKNAMLRRTVLSIPRKDPWGRASEEALPQQALWRRPRLISRNGTIREFPCDPSGPIHCSFRGLPKKVSP